MLSFRSRRYPNSSGVLPHLSKALEKAYRSLDCETARLVEVATEGLTRTTTRPPRSTIGSSRNIIPISALNPYQSRWTIKGRVTKKGDMKTWNNARGQGNLFSVDILDADGMDIRGTVRRATRASERAKGGLFCGKSGRSLGLSGGDPPNPPSGRRGRACARPIRTWR